MSNDARRQKAMSIGNAAALFGEASAQSPSDGDGAGSDFWSGGGGGKPASVPSPFASIGEEQEGEGEENAASLFGAVEAVGAGSGSGPGQDWLGSASSEPPEQQQYYQQQQQQQQEEQYDWSNAGHDGTGQFYPQQQQQQTDTNGQYGYHANGTTTSYADPSVAQEYQGNLHSQAQYANYGYADGAAAGSNGYDYTGNTSAATGYDYQQQQPQAQYPSTNYQQSTQSASYGYDQLQNQQQYQPYSQIPYSAPAHSAHVEQMPRSQSRGSHSGSAHYAQSYSAAYDPYAPAPSSSYSSSSTQQYQQSQSMSSYPSNPYAAHSTAKPQHHPALHHSQTASAIPQSSTLTPSSSATGSTDGGRKLNRSASSFFAELPALPQPKSRPVSSLARGASQPASSGPFGNQHQQQQGPTQNARSTPPPPPKSRTPAPPPPSAIASASYGPPRPSSAASNASATAAAYGYAVGSGGARPGSRTQYRQDSYGPQSARGSLDQGRQTPSSLAHSQLYQPQQQQGGNYASSSGRQSYDAGAGYVEQGSRQSIDGGGGGGYYTQQAQPEPYGQQGYQAPLQQQQQQQPAYRPPNQSQQHDVGAGQAQPQMQKSTQVPPFQQQLGPLSSQPQQRPPSRPQQNPPTASAVPHQPVHAAQMQPLQQQQKQPSAPHRQPVGVSLPPASQNQPSSLAQIESLHPANAVSATTDITRPFPATSEKAEAIPSPPPLAVARPASGVRSRGETQNHPARVHGDGPSTALQAVTFSTSTSPATATPAVNVSEASPPAAQAELAEPTPEPSAQTSSTKADTPAASLSVQIPASTGSAPASPNMPTSASGWDFDDDIGVEEVAVTDQDLKEENREDAHLESQIDRLTRSMQGASVSSSVQPERQEVQVKSEPVDEEDAGQSVLATSHTQTDRLPEETAGQHQQPVTLSAYQQAPASKHVKQESFDTGSPDPMPSLHITAPSPSPHSHAEAEAAPRVKKEESEDEVLDEEEAEAAWELDQAEAELELEMMANDDLAGEMDMAAQDPVKPEEPEEAAAQVDQVSLQSNDPYAAPYDMPTFPPAAPANGANHEDVYSHAQNQEAEYRHDNLTSHALQGASEPQHAAQDRLQADSTEETSVQPDPYAGDGAYHYQPQHEQLPYSADTQYEPQSQYGDMAGSGYHQDGYEMGQSSDTYGYQSATGQDALTNDNYAPGHPATTYDQYQYDSMSQPQQVATANDIHDPYAPHNDAAQPAYDQYQPYAAQGTEPYASYAPQHERIHTSFSAQGQEATRDSYPQYAHGRTPYESHAHYMSDGQQPQQQQQQQQQQQSQPYDPYANTSHLPYSSPYQPSSTAQSLPSDKRPPIPLASFGVNGKLVTFFPSTATFSSSDSVSYGMPYEGSSGASGSKAVVKIQKISDLLPTDHAALEAFPGPLFMDTSATSSAGKAKKKKEVLAWLQMRIDEHEKASGYSGSSIHDSSRREAEEKTVLFRLLRVLLEHDGKLTGSVKVDEEVRNALLPRLAAHDGSASQFTSIATLRQPQQGIVSNGSSSTASASSADLDALQEYLLRGDKKEAVRYALDHRLWAHALVIANGADGETRALATKEFIEAELANQAQTSGREPLRVAYSLLSGAGPASIQEFVPKQSLLSQAHSGSSVNLATSSPYNPISRAPSPSPSAPARSEYPTDIPVHVLGTWRETAAMVLANRSASDSLSLTSLGDALAANDWLKAAHACFLLSSQISAVGGDQMPGVRYALLGGAQASRQPAALRDLDSVMLTEIIEFALSFVVVPKGHEAYVGLPHLQAYRLVHALELSDLGLHSQAQRYVDAIGATLKLATKASPFYHPALLAQVKELSDRLSNVSFQDKSGSWISRKVQRPTLDNVWSTLEGRFAKFVAGEAEEDAAVAAKRKQADEASKPVAGPFAHYSSITPQGPDSVSRNASSTDLSRATPPPQPQQQPTSVPNTVARTQKVATHHRRSSSYGYGPYGADPYLPYAPQMPDIPAEDPAENSVEQSQDQHLYNAGHNAPQYGYETPQNDSGWWGAANGGTGGSTFNASSGNNTPGYGQPPMFSPVEEGSEYLANNASALMSPMDFSNANSMSFQQANPQSRLNTHSSQVNAPPTIEEDDDELGLGNSSAKRKKEQTTANASDSGRGSSEPPPSSADSESKDVKKDQKTVKPAASSSWLGRIFKRDGGSPQSGPIRAKLGDETSFVYDPVEKRWVNKKVGADTPPPAAVAPPPRAQTASPTAHSQSYSTPPPAALSRSVGATPPPPRGTATPPPPPSTTGTPPPPSSTASTPGGPPMKSGDMPPPPKRPSTTTGGASRKNVRARYVDVLAQQQ